MTKILTPKAAIDYAAKTLQSQDDARERVAVITLRQDNSAIRCHLVGIGDYTHCIADKRYIAKQAILDNAVAIILLHTHNGSSAPSQKDTSFTSELKGCLSTIGIALVDHVICGLGEFYSYADERVFTNNQ